MNINTWAHPRVTNINTWAHPSKPCVDVSEYNVYYIYIYNSIYVCRHVGICTRECILQNHALTFRRCNAYLTWLPQVDLFKPSYGDHGERIVRSVELSAHWYGLLVCVCIYIYVCVCVYIYIYIYICFCALRSWWVDREVRRAQCVLIWPVGLCVCVYIYIYIYIYMFVWTEIMESV